MPLDLSWSPCTVVLPTSISPKSAFHFDIDFMVAQIKICRRRLVLPSQPTSTSTRFAFDLDIDFIIFSFFILHRADPPIILRQKKMVTMMAEGQQKKMTIM
ncbi:hypothetical protein Dimus_027102 [Dionaea muscipula]